MNFPIEEPIWNVKKFMPHAFGRGVGIAKNKIKDEDITVEILYKDKSGERLYPKPFKVNRASLSFMPVAKIKGTELIIIPISELQVLN